jgi:hypothetical protein
MLKFSRKLGEKYCFHLHAGFVPGLHLNSKGGDMFLQRVSSVFKKMEVFITADGRMPNPT